MNQQEEDAAFQELQRRVEEARLVLERDPNHALRYGQVMSILSMFGTKLKETGAPYSDDACEDERQAALLGMQRRQWNALLCAEKIVPLWSLSAVEPYLSSDDVDKLRVLDLRKHLEEAKNAVLLREEYSPPEFEPTEDSLVSSLREQSKSSKAINQAKNAYRTIQWQLRIACCDEFNIFDASEIYPDEWDGDWRGIPSAIDAAYTFAGVPNNQHWPLDDADARREFWLWWLDEAVPASWNLEYL